MTEALDLANLVLGIIGTITGSIAIILHFWRLRKESPHLKIKVSECKHIFTETRKRETVISFEVDFHIKNLGDRGTSINDAELTLEEDGKKYLLKKQSFRVEDSVSREGWMGDRKWISPHETTDMTADFWIRYEGEKREEIDCTLTIYHTHGAERVKAVSQKRK